MAAHLVKEATEAYQLYSDPLHPFFEDRCDLGEFKVTKGALWDAYVGWCYVNQEPELNRRDFTEKMKARFGLGCRGTGGVRCWQGLRLRASDTSDTTKALPYKLPMENVARKSYPKRVDLCHSPSQDTEKSGLSDGLVTQLSASGALGPTRNTLSRG